MVTAFPFHSDRAPSVLMIWFSAWEIEGVAATPSGLENAETCVGEGGIHPMKVGVAARQSGLLCTSHPWRAANMSWDEAM